MNNRKQREEERNTTKLIEGKILHVLSLFPIISPSMLQMSMGTGISADMWKPVLDRLVEEGAVYRYEILTQTPGGRNQAVTCISSRPDPAAKETTA